MATLNEAISLLKDTVASAGCDDVAAFPLCKVAAYSELCLSFFKGNGNDALSFDVEKSLQRYNHQIKNHITRIRQLLEDSSVAEPLSFAAFARNNECVLGLLRWADACPTLKWLLYAVELMNEFMFYEEGNDADGGGFFCHILSERRLSTDSVAQVLWLVSLADAWNLQNYPRSGEISIEIFVSLDHVWFGYQNQTRGVVSCELCCTPTSSDLVLACIGKDPSMIFRNTFLMERISGDNDNAVSDDTVCKLSLSHKEFACYLLTQTAMAVKELIKTWVPRGGVDPCGDLIDALCTILQTTMSMSLSFQGRDCCIDQDCNFLLGCLLQTVDKLAETFPAAESFRKELCDVASSIIPYWSEQSQPITTLECFDRAVQFNAENYLARAYLVDACATVDPYLGYKHACYLLDLVGVYNENGLSLKCQSVYQSTFDIHRELQAAHQFNETSENEYIADIPEIQKFIAVTWDVEFEGDPSSTQPFEYVAQLHIRAKRGVENSDVIVGESTLGASAWPRLYVNYISTGEKYFIRFKSHEACEHLMEDGSWETFPYFISDGSSGDDDNEETDGNELKPEAEEGGQISSGADPVCHDTVELCCDHIGEIIDVVSGDVSSDNKESISVIQKDCDSANSAGSGEVEGLCGQRQCKRDVSTIFNNDGSPTEYGSNSNSSTKRIKCDDTPHTSFDEGKS